MSGWSLIDALGCSSYQGGLVLATLRSLRDVLACQRLAARPEFLVSVRSEASLSIIRESASRDSDSAVYC